LLKKDVAVTCFDRYSKVEVEQLVVFHCRMVGHDVGELLQVLEAAPSFEKAQALLLELRGK
jgi:hypothetical protein